MKDIIISTFILLYYNNMATTNNNNSKVVKNNNNVSKLTLEEKMAIYNEIAVEKKEAELKAKELNKQNIEARNEIKKQIKANKEAIRKLQMENKELVSQWNELYEPIRQIRNGNI
jgi:hypothetical protein